MANIHSVANGRRLSARKVIMQTTATLKGNVWRKVVLYANPNNPQEPEDVLSFEALQLSQQDEADYKYDELMSAYVLFDKFHGGYMHDNETMNNPMDISIYAQIELADGNLTFDEQVRTIPNEQLKIGDLIAIAIPLRADIERDDTEPLIIWFEVVGIDGQSMLSDFGRKFLLNRRDDLIQALFN